MERPTTEDLAALRLLLERENVFDYDAEFVGKMRNRLGEWRPKRAWYVEAIWEKYNG